MLTDCVAAYDLPAGHRTDELVVLAIEGNIPGTSCDSPSSAFLD